MFGLIPTVLVPEAYDVELQEGHVVDVAISVPTTVLMGRVVQRLYVHIDMGMMRDHETGEELVNGFNMFADDLEGDQIVSFIMAMDMTRSVHEVIETFKYHGSHWLKPHHDLPGSLLDWHMLEQLTASMYLLVVAMREQEEDD